MLELPQTLRTARPDEVPNDPEVLARIKQAEAANIVEGYVLKDNTSQELPFKFYAEININNSRLWELFVELVGQLPGEVSCIYGQHDDDPNYSKYLDKQSVLNVLSNYQAELMQDCNVEFGLIYHAEDKLNEVFVKDTKYIQVWGTNEVAFRQLMNRLELDEVPDMNFVDEFPKAVESLQTFLPDTRPTYLVIQELEKALQ